MPRNLLPSFQNRSATPLESQCKCSNGIYTVSNLEDVPLLLRDLTEEDMQVLRPFEIHCGDYKRMMHGYRQRTGPVRVTWCPVLVEDKIDSIEDQCRKWKLQNVFMFLIRKGDCSYFKFVEMQRNRAKKPFLYEIFSSPEYEGIECALWPTLYHTTSLCESLIHSQSNHASGKITYMHKVLSSIEDYRLNFELLHTSTTTGFSRPSVEPSTPPKHLGVLPTLVFRKSPFRYLLAMAASVLNRCSLPIRISILLSHHQFVRVDISLTSLCQRTAFHLRS